MPCEEMDEPTSEKRSGRSNSFKQTSKKKGGGGGKVSVGWLANVARELLSANQPLLISEFGREGEGTSMLQNVFLQAKRK